MTPQIASSSLRARARAVLAIAALTLASALVLPELAEAALKNAAGGAGRGGGFADLTRYLDRVATLLIPVGGAGAVLGVMAGGFMLIGGNPRATRVLGYVAVGLVIVLASKGLAA
jgi:type IV secretory pathway VirB2 component (pilin)